MVQFESGTRQKEAGCWPMAEKQTPSMLAGVGWGQVEVLNLVVVMISPGLRELVTARRLAKIIAGEW